MTPVCILNSYTQYACRRCGSNPQQGAKVLTISHWAKVKKKISLILNYEQSEN